MGKSVGYIVALVAIGLIVYFLATKGKSEPTQAGPKGAPVHKVLTVSYATLADSVANAQAQLEKARAEAIPQAKAMVPAHPPIKSIVHGRLVEDKGKVLSVNPGPPASVTVDVDGDGNADVELTLSGAAPSDVTPGAQITFTGQSTDGQLQGDHLVISVKAQTVGAAGAQPAAQPAAQ